MFSEKTKKSVELLLSNYLAKKVVVSNSCAVGGGCINQAMKLETNYGDFFLKKNIATLREMFKAEAKGLSILTAAGAMKTPGVIGTGETDDNSFLILEFIHPAPRAKSFWEIFGRGLASQHRVTQALFGLHHNNYIGNLPQSNTQHPDWISFFIHERLEPQLQRALEKQLLQTVQARHFHQLYKRLPDLLPDEPPALLHGDLWSGNFLTGNDGQALLIDPAVYYGHREAELAFTHLFGGFDARFYAAYHAAYPVHQGFNNRMDIYNIYPLLVHANLFGSSYVTSVKTIFEQVSVKAKITLSVLFA